MRHVGTPPLENGLYTVTVDWKNSFSEKTVLSYLLSFHNYLVIFFLKVRRFSRIDEKSSLNLTLYLRRITPREINSNRFHYRIDIEQS